MRILAENKCLFKYVNGTSGSIKATSQVIHIINTELQVSPLHVLLIRRPPCHSLITKFSGKEKHVFGNF